MTPEFMLGGLALGSGAMNLYDAMNWGKGYGLQGMQPLDKPTRQLQDKTNKQIRADYDMAKMGRSEFNLAAPAISNIKTQIDMQRKMAGAAMAGRSARISNSDGDMAGGSSLSRVMSLQGQQAIQDSLAPVNAKNNARANTYFNAAGKGNEIYQAERRKAVQNYQVAMQKYLDSKKKSSGIGGALGGLAGIGLGIATGGFGFAASPMLGTMMGGMAGSQMGGMFSGY
jgi:hypothetical protein